MKCSEISLFIETELLLLCTKASVDHAVLDRIYEIIVSGVDWSAFRVLVEFHNLQCLVYTFLQSLDSVTIPVEIMASMDQKLFAISCENLRLTSVLHNIIDICASSNITVVPFKGPLLSQLAYGEINLRSFVDLDLFVSKNEVIQVRDLLLTEGFTAHPDIPINQTEGYLTYEDHFVLFNAKENINIDLHWDISGGYSVVPLFFNEVLDHLRSIPVAGKKCVILSQEDTVVHLCLHASSHCWLHLEQICSITHTLHNAVEIDWDKIWERARSLRCRRIVLLGLSLCTELYDLKIPESAQKSIDSDKGVQRWRNKIIQDIANGTIDITVENFSWRFSGLHFGIRDSWADNVRYGLRMLFRPTMKEWQTFPQAGSFPLLYFVYRPLRLMGEFATKFIAMTVRRGEV